MNQIKYIFFTVLIACVIGAGFLWVVLDSDANEVYFTGFESGKVDTKRYQLDKKLDCEIELEEKNVRTGNYAIRFEAGPESRCEIVPYVFEGSLGKYKREPFNEERWYAFSLMLGEPWELNEQNEVIAQWHSTRDRFFFEDRGRGPPLALRIIGGYWYLTYGWDSDLLSEKGPKAFHKIWHDEIETGDWMDWVFRIRWSWGDDGLIEVWKDGELQLSHSGPNTYNDVRGNYLKLGPYHSGVSRTVFMDNVYVGGTRPSDELGDAE